MGQTRIDLLINLEYQKELEKLKRDLNSTGIKINPHLDLNGIQQIKRQLEASLGNLSDFKFTTNSSGAVKSFFATYQNELNQTVKAQYKLNEIQDKSGKSNYSLDLVSQQYLDNLKKRETATLKSDEAMDKAFIKTSQNRKRQTEDDAKYQNKILDDNYQTQLKQSDEYSRAESSIRQRKTREAENEAKVLNKVARENLDAQQKQRIVEQDRINNLKLYAKEYQKIATLQSKKGGFNFEKQSVLDGGKLVSKGVIFETPEATRFFQEIDDGTGKIRKYTMETDKATGSTKILSSGWKEAQRNHMTFNQEMSIAIRRIAEWAIATQLVYGSLHSLGQGIRFIYDLSNSLNEIRIVTNQSVEMVNKLAKGYNDLAIAMGSTTSEITKSSVEYYRQGLSQDETNKRMEATIKYSKISGLAMKESTDIITASANATKKDVNEIIDVFSLLGDSSAAGADEIGVAMQKSAAASENAGVSFSKLASWITEVSSTTRESAETIGKNIAVQCRNMLNYYRAKSVNSEMGIPR